jgi:hypothetical protein
LGYAFGKGLGEKFINLMRIYTLGIIKRGLLAISGAPSVQVSSKEQNFLRKVMAEFGKGAIITCATSRDVVQLTEQEQEHLGVFAGHAYTLLKIY